MSSFIKWFQDFSFRKSRYERPAGKWVCGHSGSGWRCSHGPNLEGKCVTSSQCQPFKKGDRWVCTRGESMGGPCPNGPLPDGKCACPVPPCVPLLSIRARRGRLCLLIAALAFALLCILLGSYNPKDLMAPGALNAHHSPQRSKCEVCHSSLNADFSTWVSTAARGQLLQKQNELCLNCHDNFKVEDFQKIHSLPSARLAEFTEQIKRSPHSQTITGVLESLVTPAVPTHGDGHLACATCHREHRGGHANISDLSNDQCQTCHAKQFAGFTAGHPELGRTVLMKQDVLNDSTFVKKLLDQKGTAGSLSEKFWKSLSAELQSKLQKMPAQGLADDAIMKSLIAAANDFLKAQGQQVKDAPGAYAKRKGARIEFQKEFPDEISANFSYPYQRRTRVAFNHSSHINEYFPTSQKKEKVPTTCTDCHVPEDAGKTMAYRGFQFACATCHTSQIVPAQEDQNNGFALFRVPQLDVATFVKNNIPIGQYPANAQGEMSVITKMFISGDPSYPEFNSDLDQISSLSSWEDLSECSPEQLKALQRVILGMKRLFFDFSKQGKEALKARMNRAIGSQISPDVIEFLLKPIPEVAIKNNQSKAFPNLETEMASPQGPSTTTLLFGNAESMDYSLLYKAKKHTDNYLQTWLTTTVMSRSARSIFESSTQLYRSFQSCVICHTVEVDEHRQASINWHTWSEKLSERKFTKFSHAPHLTVTCQQCHVMEQKVDHERFKNSFKRTNPLSLEPVFQAMDKSTCVACHNPDANLDGCLICHQYHIGKFKPRSAKSSHFKRH